MPLRLLIVLGLASGCGQRTTPQDPGLPALPGTRAHACPDIDRPQPSSGWGRGTCTLMACGEGFDIDLYAKEGWPPGAYRFVVTRDGTSTTTCDGTLSPESCPGSRVTCDDEGAVVVASGCAPPAATQLLGSIGVDGYPKTVDIDVLHDGVLLTRAHYDVTYTVFYPNGPECGTVCCSASPGALTLPKRK